MSTKRERDINTHHSNWLETKVFPKGKSNYVISFDCGIRNMSYGIFDGIDSVLHLETTNIVGGGDNSSSSSSSSTVNTKHIATFLNSVMDKITSTSTEDNNNNNNINITVLLEIQMKTSKRIFMIYTCMEMYFLAKKIPVHLISPVYKMQLFKLHIASDVVEEIEKKYKDKYTSNKMLGIHWIKNHVDCPYITKAIRTCNRRNIKLDDMCDTVAQFLAVMNIPKKYDN